MRAVLLTAAVLAAGCLSSARGPERDGQVPDGAAADLASPAPDLAPPTLLPPETAAIAGELHGAFLELACMGQEIEFQFCVPKDLGIRSLSLKFGGLPGTTYSVVLAIWGVMETIKYKGGTLSGESFYTGGSPDTPMTAEYGLEIDGQTYFLNYREIGAGEHYTYGIQYQTPPISIPGGATVKLFVRDPDNFVNTNHMQSMVTDPPPRLREQLRRIDGEMPQSQFVYVEVQSAAPR
jgi:hypothetical protein